VRALLIRETGKPAECGEAVDPVPSAGESLLSVLAAPLNPVDVSIAGGRFFGGHPALPYVPGVEAVGRVTQSNALPVGTVAFTCLDGLGISRSGSCAEFVVVRDCTLVPVPDGVAPTEAAALGTAGLAAWIPLTRLTQITADDTVLVLGATGAVGQVAIQTARLLGARRVVGAGRNTEKLAGLPDLGADATVNLSDEGDLAAAFVRACGDIKPTVVFDPLWGPPMLAALEAAATGARVLHLGQSAAAEVAMPSGLVRGKSLKIFGYTTLNVAAQEVTDSYRELVTELAHGHIRIDVTTVPLASGAKAWVRQQAGPEAKLVICP
jgi:NADPH:quinone reductase